MSLYANTDWTQVATNGGCVTVSVTAGTNAQGNGGTSLPCKIAYISQGLLTASVVRFGVNASLTASLGAIVPTAEGGVSPSVPLPPPVRVAIDDVSKLWFASAATACLGISYLY